MNPGDAEPCPCGSGSPWAGCCAPVLADARVADTAERLMRSRYSAFVVGDGDHLWRTWHPSTRPPDVAADEHTAWTGLDVRRTEAGGPDDDTGVVEFVASYREGDDGRRGRLHEVSRFARRAGRWFYVDGDVRP